MKRIGKIFWGTEMEEVLRSPHPVTGERMDKNKSKEICSNANNIIQEYMNKNSGINLDEYIDCSLALVLHYAMFESFENFGDYYAE